MLNIVWIIELLLCILDSINRKLQYFSLVFSEIKTSEKKSLPPMEKIINIPIERKKHIFPTKK